MAFLFKTSNYFKIEKNVSFYLQIANSLHKSSTVFYNAAKCLLFHKLREMFNCKVRSSDIRHVTCQWVLNSKLEKINKAV
jgi:hypothetical protein